MAGALPTWGGRPIYDQLLWNVPKKLYRIASNDVAERVLRKRQRAVGFDWLMTKRADLDRLAEAFEQAMEGLR